MNKKELIHELIEMHKKQRSWHHTVYGETLDIEKLESMSIEELQAVYDAVSKKKTA